jgi:hypothetical protein
MHHVVRIQITCIPIYRIVHEFSHSGINYYNSVTSDFIGNALLTVEQQSTLKTRRLCLPLVSDNPWEPGQNEAEEIENVVLEDMGLQQAPQQGAHDYHKYVNTKTQYEKQIAYLRELLNHTFLRAVYTIPVLGRQGWNTRRYKNSSLTTTLGKL